MVENQSFRKRNVTRLTESGSKLLKDSLGCHVKRTIQRAPAGTPVTSSTEAFCDLGYVQPSFAADTEPILVGRRNLPQKDGGFNSGDTDQVVNNALAILGSGPRPFHVLGGHPAPCKWAFNVEVGERRTQ
jgi:hypothetical protein